MVKDLYEWKLSLSQMSNNWERRRRRRIVYNCVPTYNYIINKYELNKLFNKRYNNVEL